MPVGNLQIAGRHNLQNVLAAFALADTLDVPVDGLIAGAQLFAGLPHRMQIIASSDGINWIDDSKATNEAAALASIEAVEGRLILIAGGDAKGGELLELAGKLGARDVFVIALGKDAQLFSERLADCCEVRCVADMDAAVQLAATEANVGDTVLLAPACSSLDMYSGFAERGEHFAAALGRLQ
jgi:UDP-N-acetylmuramoylalanine--D-glutamate ligase